MPKLTDNQKSLAILGGGLVVAIGFGVVSYLHYGELQEVKTENAALETKKQANDARIAFQADLKNQLVAYEKIVDENSRILPREEDLTNFVRVLGEVEKETGVTIKVLPNYQPSTDKRVGGITRIPMKLQLQATTQGFLRFLNSLERNDRLVTVTDFRVNPSNESAKPGQDPEHDVSMSFDLYRYSPVPGGGPGETLVHEMERMKLMDEEEVQKILREKGKPAFVYHYALRARETRRDPFLDPRRKVGRAGVDVGDGTNVYTEEELQLDILVHNLELAQKALESYRASQGSSDILRQTANKEKFLKDLKKLEDEIGKVSKGGQEFQSRDIQEKYVDRVKRPYEQLRADASDLVGDSRDPQAFSISVAEATRFRNELKALVDERKFAEANEKWGAIEALRRDAEKRIDAGAVPIFDDMRGLGTHASFQVMLAQKKLKIEGVVRMQRPADEEGEAYFKSAIVVNGKILEERKNLDNDLVFMGVAEDGRILFRLRGHEVDWVPPKQEIPMTENAILRQE